MTTLQEKWQQPQVKLHRKDLARRGISIEQAAERGYEPLTAKESYSEIGQATGPTIAITCYRANGKPRKDRRYRLLDAEKIAQRRGKRYTQKKDTGILVHIRKPTEPAKAFRKRRVITEGEIKADQIAEYLGVTAISVPGVDCFKGKDGKLHPALANLKWDGYTAEFAYDTDQAEKPQVRRALLECADSLAAMNVKVQFREIPNVPNAEKTGADDVIQHMGTDAYIRAPLHDLDSPLVKKWREVCQKLEGNHRLPEAMRGLEPIGPHWYDEEPPAPEYILLNYLQKNEVALVAGQAGVSKSTWTMYAAVGLASGTKFFAQKFDRTYRTMYCMLERHRDSFRRRFNKIAKDVANSLDGDPNKFRTSLLSNFIAKALAGENMNFIEYKNQQWVRTPLVDELIAELIQAGIEIMILDPISRLYGGEENGEVFNALTKAFEYIVQQANCTIIVVHHAGKDGTANGGKYAGRGASQLTDNTSETIAVAEYIGADRNGLGDLSVLRPGEEKADIIRVKHTRCSDGALTEPAFFVRNPETGLLRQINMRPQTVDDKLQELLTENAKFQAWAKGRTFTKNEFVEQADAVLPRHVAEKKVKKLFVDAVTARIFAEQGKRGRGVLYAWQGSETVPENDQLGKPVPNRRPTAQQKNQGEHRAR